MCVFQNIKIRRKSNILFQCFHFYFKSKYIFTNSPAQARLFIRSLTSFNSGFSFSLTGCSIKVKEPSVSYYLLIAGGRMVGFIPFAREFTRYEM